MTAQLYNLIQIALISGMIGSLGLLFTGVVMFLDARAASKLRQRRMRRAMPRRPNHRGAYRRAITH